MNKKIIPHKKQLDFLEWEFGVFFHFGIRTFYEGHKDWDMESMSLEGFCPSELDCENWIKTIKEAGAKYAILVTKHHDGFANWPSKYTDYSVANTPWKSGNGDVVSEYVDACRKYNIKVGLYYSPAEFGLKENKSTDKEYDDYFINQISELLSNYGKIDYLWFDGCGSEGHKYDEQRIIKEIRTHQPDILIFNMWDPDTRWVGNEAGIVSLGHANAVSSVDFSILTDVKDEIGELQFLPGECDCMIRLENWFYSDNDAETLKSIDELMGLYYHSVGRGANLLINIAPDRHGLLPDKDAKRIIEFGEEVRNRFSNSIKNTQAVENQRHSIVLDKSTLVNHVVIKEDLTEGESIEGFKLYVQPYPYGEKQCVFIGESVGHKRICSFPTIYTAEVVVEITKANGDYKLDGIDVFYIK